MHGKQKPEPFRNHGHQRNQAAASRKRRREELDADELMDEAYLTGQRVVRAAFPTQVRVGR